MNIISLNKKSANKSKLTIKSVSISPCLTMSWKFYGNLKCVLIDHKWLKTLDYFSFILSPTELTFFFHYKDLVQLPWFSKVWVIETSLAWFFNSLFVLQIKMYIKLLNSNLVFWRYGCLYILVELKKTKLNLILYLYVLRNSHTHFSLYLYYKNRTFFGASQFLKFWPWALYNS